MDTLHMLDADFRALCRKKLHTHRRHLTKSLENELCICNDATVLVTSQANHCSASDPVVSHQP